MKISKKQKNQIEVYSIMAVIIALCMLTGFGIGRATAPKNVNAEELVVPQKTAFETVVMKETIKAEEITPTDIYYDVPLNKDLQNHIANLCAENEVPMDLVIAVIEQESDFRPDVISPTNDYGLMQINAVNHEWLKEELGVSDILDPYDNTTCGVYMLGNLIKKYNGYSKALMAYNMGEGGAKKHWSQGTYQSSYSKSVLSKMNSYKTEKENATQSN